MKIFILDSTSKLLSASITPGLGSVDFITVWADNNGNTFTEGSTDGQLTSTSEVTIIPAPSSGVRRVVKSINLFNRGTETQTIAINFVNGASSRIANKVTLVANQSWSLEDPPLTTAVSTSGVGSAYKNFIINGNFKISQRTKPETPAVYTASSNFKATQGAYTHDRWFALSSLSDTSTAIFPASMRSIGLDVAQGTSGESIGGSTVSDTSCILRGIGMPVRKFGIAQVIDSSPSLRMAGQQVTLSFKAKASTTSGTKFPSIRGSILTTAAGFTRTFVSAWNTYLSDPTLNGITNAGVVGTTAVANFTGSSPIGTALTTSWQTFTVNATIASGNTNNRIAVMIWVENDGSQILTSTDEVYIQDVQLEIGATATSFEAISTADNLTRCQEYGYGVYGVVGGQTSYGSGVWQLSALGTGQSFLGVIDLPVRMRVTPSVSFSTNVTPVITGVLSALIAATTTTTVTLADASTFPNTAVSSTNYFLQIPASATTNEFVRVTAKSSGSNALTITRGQAGTTATSVAPAGSIITGVSLLGTAIGNTNPLTTLSPLSTVLLPSPSSPFFQLVQIGAEIFAYNAVANATTLTGVTRAQAGSVAAVQAANTLIRPISYFESYFNLSGKYGEANPIYLSGIGGFGASQTQVRVTLPRRIPTVVPPAFVGANTLIDGGSGLSYVFVDAEI